jgi:CheY-like chemotaxis protein
MNLFLAEDDVDDSYLFGEALRELNHKANLYVAENGEDFMHMLLSAPTNPDIIFLDLNMPIKNGFECMEEIKSSESLRNIPVVVLSTSGSPDSVQSAHDMGAHMYIQKPTDFSDLKKAIKSCTERDWNFIPPPPMEEFLYTA